MLSFSPCTKTVRNVREPSWPPRQAFQSFQPQPRISEDRHRELHVLFVFSLGRPGIRPAAYQLYSIPLNQFEHNYPKQLHLVHFRKHTTWPVSEHRNEHETVEPFNRDAALMLQYTHACNVVLSGDSHQWVTPMRSSAKIPSKTYDSYAFLSHILC